MQSGVEYDLLNCSISFSSIFLVDFGDRAWMKTDRSPSQGQLRGHCPVLQAGAGGAGILTHINTNTERLHL